MFLVTQSRSSSFYCQIVVRETENRQLLDFFCVVRGICGSLTCQMAAGRWVRGCPIPALFARAGSDAAGATFVRSVQTPLRMRSWCPPFAKDAKDGAPHCVGYASKIKSAWATCQSDGQNFSRHADVSGSTGIGGPVGSAICSGSGAGNAAAELRSRHNSIAVSVRAATCRLSAFSSAKL